MREVIGFLVFFNSIMIGIGAMAYSVWIITQQQSIYNAVAGFAVMNVALFIAFYMLERKKKC